MSSPFPKWATEPIRIADPDPTWPEKARRLQHQLSTLGIPNSEHIGSTAVPDLPAKPIIDLLATIPSFDNIEALVEPLRHEDWHYVPPELDQRPYRRLLIKVENEKRAAHLHLMLPHSVEREAEILFRNLLIRNQPLRAQYAALKKGLAAEHADDREAYTNAKTQFIKNALAMAAKPRIIFATNNQHKVIEIQSAIGDKLEVISLKAAGIDIDIPEPHDTLEANATEKSSTIHKLTNDNCFSEDTGLEVMALGGEPGVLSARYAGETRSFEENIKKLLTGLGDNPDRRARFRTVISLNYNNTEHLFEGICEGRILPAPDGDDGFGYDPIFVPEGDTRSFGRMTLEEKNRYSHRRKAADQLVAFLQTQI
ncbi:RdgB/HAM1 family non-canonical purine NTP pyrophosphatase [Puia sp.]|jgi:XTP/dITP diphosphohydrolase|uniref:RdgB/HAM1 family non-canonical purine NTP pyrophosphatase n=1 Tax=Puia sp. TaxID=2045100 RepID=UPI002F4006BC